MCSLFSNAVLWTKYLMILDSVPSVTIAPYASDITRTPWRNVRRGEITNLNFHLTTPQPSSLFTSPFPIFSSNIDTTHFSIEHHHAALAKREAKIS
jgi:hypothetical protein